MNYLGTLLSFSKHLLTDTVFSLCGFMYFVLAIWKFLLFVILLTVDFVMCHVNLTLHSDSPLSVGHIRRVQITIMLNVAR